MDEDDDAQLPGLDDLLRMNLAGELHGPGPILGMVVGDKWQLTRHLGSGRFGTVFEAWHVELDQAFAIKFNGTHRGGGATRAQRRLEPARLTPMEKGIAALVPAVSVKTPRQHRRRGAMIRNQSRSMIIGIAILGMQWLFCAMAWAEPKRTPNQAEIERARELRRQSDRLYEDGEYDTAVSTAEKACSILEKQLGGQSADLGNCMSHLGTLHMERKDFKTAEAKYARAVSILERVMGLKHIDVADALNGLAVAHGQQGEHREAKSLLEQALAIREDVLGPEHPDVANSLYNLAMQHSILGDRKTGETLLERALNISEKARGPNHPDVAHILVSIAQSHMVRSEYEEAEIKLKRAVSIMEASVGPSHPKIVWLLDTLALAYRGQGKLEEAEALLERALSILEHTLSPDHPDVAGGLTSLGAVYVRQGRYDEAAPLLERGLSIREKALGPGHHWVSDSLQVLALLYQAQGEYERAKASLERALAINKARYGPGHPLIALGLNNLGGLLQDQRKYAEAEQTFEQALVIYEKAFGPDHPMCATTVGNLALTYTKQKKYAKAEQFFQRALIIEERTSGPENPEVAVQKNNLARLYDRMGRYEEAHPLYKASLPIIEKSLGPSHPRLATALANLGHHHFALGRYEPALEFLRRSLDIQEKNLTQFLVVGDESRKLAHAATIFWSTHNALSLHLRALPNHHAVAEIALTTLLRRKGRVLALVAQAHGSIRRSLPAEHHDLLKELASIRGRYSTLTHRGPDGRSMEEFVARLSELEQKSDALWQAIVTDNPVVESLAKPVTIDDIQGALPHGAALVEFIQYIPRHTEARAILESWTGSPHYAAYLVFPDHFDWVDLGPAEPIEQHIKAFRRALQLKQAIPPDLHDAVMQPIIDRLGDARRLFIAPDADLNLVPFGALHDGERYLIERYDLHYLTTGRDLLRPWDAYGSTTDDTLTVVANPTGADLPGTEREAELLEELFPHVETLLHDTATEAGAQRRAQPWMLHLATHGFFEIPEPDPKLEARMNEYILSMSPSALPFAPGRLDNPMLHSGLLLASADTPADPPADPDDEHITADGRLTAYEISGWDLRGTELVVLSACGSGLGEPRAGEGVLGLRRAFAMAGAQTQVMSLWDVSDATTATLMEAYYRKLLAGKGRAEAMQEVQLEMLRSGEHHPGDWASFVVVGEWRPLSKDRLPQPEGPPPVEPAGCGCQRASIGGTEQPPGLLLLGLLGVLSARRRRRQLDARW